MNANAKKILLNIAYPLIVVAVVIAIWWIGAAVIGVSLVLPTPVEALREFFAYFADSAFWMAIGNSMWRSLYAFLISFVFALTFAVASRLWPVVYRFTRPFISVIRAIPTMSVIFILILLLDSARAPAAVAIIVIFPTLFSSFYAAICSVDEKLAEMCRVYHVGLKDRLLKLYLPNMVGGLFEGAASGFSLNIKLVIAAEVMAHTVRSFGNLMYNTNWMLETQKLFALTIAAVILSVACEWIIRLVGRAVVRWK